MTDDALATAARKIQQARTSLVLDAPFWGTLVLMLKPVATDAVPMGATDGTHLIYNTEYINRIPHAEVLGLVAEEVGHCALGHIWRKDGRQHRRWNIACDHVLCSVLKSAGFNTGDMLSDPAATGKSAEWQYARLPQDPPQGGKGGGQPGKQGAQGQPGKGNSPQGGGGRAEVLDPPQGGNAADGETEVRILTEGDWQQAVQQAVAAAKARGNLPASLDRFAQAAVAARVDWKSVLRRFVQAAATADYSWTRPSRRYLAGGLYLPSLRSEAMGPIAVAVDTSGSIDNVTLGQFFAEINSIAQEMQPERVVVIYCDAKVGRVDTFERDEEIVAHPVGGGGTSHVPVMDHVDAMEDPPVALVCLTDLQTAHRASPPAMPVLWAATRQGQVPYGETVSMEAV